MDEITDKVLKGLFDAVDGRRSHYLFLNDESEEFIALLKKEDWVVYVKNTEKKPMYRITVKLYEKFAELDDDTKKQLAWAAKMDAMDEEERSKEEARLMAKETPTGI